MPPGAMLVDGILTGLPADRIRGALAAAPGNELASGKFLSPRSSSALAANAFGLFLDDPGRLPAIPGCEDHGWPAASVHLEAVLRFPWGGGRHPCLDVLVETETALIGIESKRFEPFGSTKRGALSEAYWRPVWGPAMARHEAMQDMLRAQTTTFSMLDAPQLIKHALALRTEVRRAGRASPKRPVLLYVFAEPTRWPDGRPIASADRQRHRDEIGWFADAVAGDEVTFVACSYRRLLTLWAGSGDPGVREHAARITACFAP
ncbi:hypothetical protein ACUN0C_10425 [Faunimonas sp. B44]|uniref:hypothetical protein n=1 Tax=Faunimonas sp. B44 TaxID=3461493 RepID=UPI0040445ED2